MTRADPERVWLGLCLVLLAGFAFPSPGIAQARLTVGGDLSLRTAYVWRGVERRNGPVLQPSAYISLSSGGTLVTAGWWTNIELGSPDMEDPAEVGLGRAWFGENDVSLEISGQIGPVGVTGGLVRYHFAREDSYPDARLFDTSELYGRRTLNAGSFVPEISVWHDVHEIDGAYVDTGIGYRVPTLPSRAPIISLYLSAHAGWSLGQEASLERPDSPAYFADDGLTHVDLGFTLMAGEASTYLTIEGHALLGVDSPADFPGSEGANERGSTVWWFGLTASHSAIVAVF